MEDTSGESSSKRDLLGGTCCHCLQNSMGKSTKTEGSASRVGRPFAPTEVVHSSSLNHSPDPCHSLPVCDGTQGFLQEVKNDFCSLLRG